MHLSWKKEGPNIWKSTLPRFEFIIQAEPHKTIISDGVSEHAFYSMKYFLTILYEGSPLKFSDYPNFLEIPCDRRLENMFDEGDANTKVKEILGKIMNDIFEAISFPWY